MVKIDKVIKLVHTRLIKNSLLSDNEKEYVYYSLDVVLNSIAKTIIIMIPFLVMGSMSSFIFILLVVISTRNFIGGLHFNTFWSCTGFSTFYFLLVWLMSSTYSLSRTLNIISIIAVLLITVIIAPVISKNRPTYSKKKRLRFKIVGITIMVILFIFSWISTNTLFRDIVIWGFILNTIQLIIGKVVWLYEEKKINT